MYNEEYKKGSILGALLKIVVYIILLVAFMIALLKLFPTKESLNPLYEEIFRENINAMKEAAETYFTNDRLPKEVGESVKLTLSEMLDMNLLLPFVDRYNKPCDLDKSYVLVTRTETEFELKVNLVCSQEEAYIIEHMGCNDKCLLLNCQTKNVTEYQFSRNVSKNVITGYTCEDGYSLSGTSCYKEKTVDESINASEVYETTEERKNATKEVSSVVESVEATAKYVNSSIDATENVTYSPWTSETVEYLALTENYYVNVTACPSGYINYGTETKTESNGDTYTLTRCVKKEANINYGETDTQIIKVATYDNGSENHKVGPTKTYESYYYEIGSYKIKTCKSFNYFIDSNSGYVYSYNNSGSSMLGFDFISCEGSCDLYPIFYMGSDESSVTAYKAIGQTSSSLNVTCNLGEETVTKYAQGKRISIYTYNWYRKYTIETRTKNITYSCPSGYTLDGKTCYKKVQSGYTCPSGYTLDGNVCNKTITKEVYTCDNGYTLNGNVCYKNTKVVSGYTCPVGYTLNGKTCNRTVVKTDVKNANPIYKQEYVNEYRWSTSSSLSGWSRTGEKRTTEVTDDENCSCK